MMDKRAGKTFELSWPEWVKFCAEHDTDSIENAEYGFDLDGGDSYTVACYDPPDEVAHLIESQEKLDSFNRKRWRVKWLNM